MADLFHIGEARIGRDGDLWNITDLWRAAGSLDNKRPAEWLRKEGAPHVEFLRDSLSVALGHTEKEPEITRTVVGGKAPGTWAHWQLALSYAKWISPAFAATVNAVYKAYTDGELARRDRFFHDRIALYLVNDPQVYKKLWTERLVKTMCETFRVDRKNVKGFPVFLTGIAGTLYDMILSSEVVNVIRERDPHAKGIKYFQLLTDDARRVLCAELSVVETLAIQSRDKEEFWSKVRNRYEGAPYQLSMGAE